MRFGTFFVDEIEDISDAAVIAGLFATTDSHRRQVSISALSKFGGDYWLVKLEDHYVLIEDNGGEIGRVDRVSDVIGLLTVAMERAAEGKSAA